MCRGNRATVNTVNASILSHLIIIQTACIHPNRSLYVTYPSLSTEQSFVLPWPESSQSMNLWTRPSVWKSYFFPHRIYFISVSCKLSSLLFKRVFNPPGWGCLYLKTDVLNFIPLNILHAAKTIIKIPPYSRATRAELLLPDRFSRSIYISVKSPQGFAPLHFL